MIEFYSETHFTIDNTKEISNWISDIVLNENCELGEVTYVFCDDNYLLNLNKQFLNHDTLTDIISFDNSLGKQIHGEIYISIDRVRANAKDFNVSFLDELHRVVIHGILHYCGYNDKSVEDQLKMRSKEDLCLSARKFL